MLFYNKMGVVATPPDPITTDNGFKLTSYYMSLADTEVHQQKINDPTNGIVYRTEGIFQYWVSKSARDSGTKPFSHKLVRVDSSTAPEKDCYTILYEKLKELKVSGVEMKDD
tara:strand:- start:5424 stop:5759 length:336 start_codon:yes stop_codon:yes gene_type:complete